MTAFLAPSVPRRDLDGILRVSLGDEHAGRVLPLLRRGTPPQAVDTSCRDGLRSNEGES